MQQPSVRVYWGCTTFNCDRGFYGTEETMPRDWIYCPTCAGELGEITTGARAEEEKT